MVYTFFIHLIYYWMKYISWEEKKQQKTDYIFDIYIQENAVSMIWKFFSYWSREAEERRKIKYTL